MDEVLEKLETTIISQVPSVEGKNFETLYKNWGRLGNQEERRKELLESQKSNRNNNLDKARGILDLVTAGEEDNLFKKDKVNYEPTIYVAGFNKPPSKYKNVLMLSEWMVEKPEDFYENWFVVSCPKAVRMLVVAQNRTTKCFTKYGQYRFSVRTALPGGNPCDPRKKAQCCVLDCFYQEKNNTMYVLDLIAWNNQPMTDGETEFRHYWLQNQLDELPELKTISKNNKVIFTLLPKVSCTPSSLNEFMMQYPPFQFNFPQRDGLLFYHKRSHYISGETPLVGWLYPYMVPEVLGADITVHQMYMSEKPIDYVNQSDFIQKFEVTNAKRWKGGNRRRSTNVMDTSEPKENDQSNNTSVSENEMEAEVPTNEEMMTKKVLKTQNRKDEESSSNAEN